VSDTQKKSRLLPAVRIAVSLAALGLFAVFYYKYVPLVAPFQAVLVPVLLVVAGGAARNGRLGLLLFVFFFPLVNNLPYFFGLHDPLPHAPAALVLCLAFLLGWLFRQSCRPTRLDLSPPVVKPLLVLASLAAVSALITFLRFANFAPFLSSGLYELVVNVNGTRAGGAMMSTVFNFLSYGTPLLFFLVAYSELRDRAFLARVLRVLGFSIFLSILFALAQKIFSVELGNFPAWSSIGRLNGTFKDPNSFGACLAAAIPLLLGLAFSSRGTRRGLFFSAAALGLLVLPFTGSRSTYLGVGFGLLLLLAAAKRKVGVRKRALSLEAILTLSLVLGIILIPLMMRKTELTKRLESNLETLVLKGRMDKILSGRAVQWGIALEAIRDYPVTGLGIGAFIIELPNFLQQRGLPTVGTDSTENYFLQAGAEMGLAGLAALLWLIVELLLLARRLWRQPPGDAEDDWLVLGMTAGLLILIFNQFFHSYVGAFDVNYLFWLLAAGLCSRARRSAEPREKKKLKVGFRIAAIGSIVAFGAANLLVSLGSLSIAARTEKFGWPQEFGFYLPEKDARGLDFRWTQKSAGLIWDRLGDRVIFPILASHPDIAENPVKLTVSLADRRFRKRTVLKEAIIKDHDWAEVSISLDEPGKQIPLIFETGRTWVPQKASGAPDPRSLGIGLGREWYERSSTIPPEAVRRAETFPAAGWSGEYGQALITVSTSAMRFSVGKSALGFRFWARGQKARGFPPYIIVFLDRRIAGKIVLLQDAWVPCVFPLAIRPGEHLLEVEFVNDFFDPARGEDRNVFLGDVEVLYGH